ncbi:hypothetical protein ACFPM7_06940 [Actinokineospora guangxiensis]|uniref:Ig-like domain-containing protein n=1 Tax=Actinokineospora guangxiensis TaxID=1490288 RepID=A0ABW0EJ98_9PSEU
MSIAVAIVVVMLAIGGVTPASAQTPIQLSATPSTVQAGSSFTLTWRTYVVCKAVTFSGGPAPIGSVYPGEPSSGSIVVAVPRDAKPTRYRITATCLGGRVDYTATVDVTVRTPPPVTTRPTTTTTRPPVTTTTRPPVTTTTRRPPVITPNPTTTTTTTTTATTTTTTTSTTPSTPTSTPPTTTAVPDDGDLALDRDAIQPGEDLQATGTGCVPGAGVVLTSGEGIVGSTVADDRGAFTADITFTKVEPGRHLITAECGIVLTGQVDQLVTSSLGGSSTALVVLVFFVLAGVALIRFA